VLPLAALLAPSAAVPLLCAWGAIQAGFTWALLRPRGGLLGPNLERAEVEPARIALTFDDGPRADGTDALLDRLAAAGARATFFPVGVRARACPGPLRRAIAEGHGIGNHTQTHPLLWAAAGRRRVLAEVGEAQAALADATGVTPRWFRPPMGHKNMHLAEALERHGLRQVTWSLRSYDTLLRNTGRVARRVLRNVRGGDIVLLHEGLADRRGREGAGGGLGLLLQGLAARGLTPVTLDALLAGPAAPAAPLPRARPAGAAPAGRAS
jgi:peptidoglycan/xylan/chitin deacetylase (PgdA/CDA1 family)